MDVDRERADSPEDLVAIVDELLAEVKEIKRQWGDVATSVGAGPGSREDSRATSRKGETGDPRRLVAVEMMLAGRSREEVEAHMRSSFGDEAAATILAEVYGEADGG